jgi:hypothetical protein
MAESDPLIARTEQEAERSPMRDRAARAANLFDLRRIIGAVFTVWGVLLIILGVTDSAAESHKAAGININLWAGIGMLVLGLLFVTWALTRPLGEQLREAEEGEGGAPGHAPPRGVDAAALASHQRSGRTRSDRDRTGGQGGAGT